jgi:predicted RNase H-like HicB family nuclease
MLEIDYVVWKEGKYFISQCLNVNISSFGDTKEEAVSALKEAVELYFEDEDKEFLQIDSISLGKEQIHV